MLKDKGTFPEHRGQSIFSFNVQLAEQLDNLAQKSRFLSNFKATTTASQA